MLHCGWRGLAGGIVARGARGGRRDRGGDRARDRALLLRGRRGGARSVRARSATGSPTAGCSTCPRSRAGCSPRPASTRSSQPTSAQLRARALLLPPPRRRAHRAPGRARLGRSMAEPIRDIDPATRARATSSGCASAAGPRSRSSPRPSTSPPRRWARSPRPGSSWSARTGSRTSRPSASAAATRFTWDFIGNLQSRKVKRIVPLVRLIHSVATDSALEQLGRHGEPGDRGPGRGQRRRRGGQGRGRAGRARRVHRPLPGAGRRADDDAAVRRGSRGLAAATSRGSPSSPPSTGSTRLSMGTSQDWEVAVEEGATIIRLGTSLLPLSGWI